MGQRVVFYCDVHEIKGEDAIADGDLPVIGFAGKWYKFFWCPECFAEQPFTVAELKAMIEEHGLEIKADELKRPKTGAAKPSQAGGQRQTSAGSDDAQCLWCDHSCSIGALNQHVKEHGFKGFREAFGVVCPMCNERSGVLGTHGKVHGATHIADLFQMAIRAGDPHGIVKERPKALQ